MSNTEASQEVVVAMICAEISESLPGSPSLNSETDITTDTYFDSVAVMDLVFALEEEFDISVPLNYLTEVRTIGELASVVVKLKV